MKVTSHLPIRVVTHNIRYATQSPFKGEVLWKDRRYGTFSELDFVTAHIPESFICLQEVLHSQLQDVLISLNLGATEWAFLGVGRDDGKEAGEYSPIFYQPTIWELLSHQNIWLSETPETPSKGWDAASTRILTIGEFRHRDSQRTIVGMNTHLDDQGGKSRLESAKLINTHIKKYMQEVSTLSGRLVPLFLTGDFNSETTMEAYQYMITESCVEDVHDCLPKERRYGHHYTFTGFGHEGLPPTRIDFIFINSATKYHKDEDRMAEGNIWKVKQYAVLENLFDDGIYSSDHRAVVADLEI
ncbi:hypothetical protein MMC25_001067 [Agyrium rufum]|nr:hypothetical protein [Agyrium rufum]